MRVLSLAVFSIAYLLTFYPSAEDASVVFTTLVVTAIALWFGPLGLLAGREGRVWYDPATVFNTALFYYAIKGVTLAYGTSVVYLVFIPHSDTIATYNVSAVLVGAGLLCWNLGYSAMLNGNTRRREQARHESIRTTWNHPVGGAADPYKRLRPVVAVLSLVGILSLSLFFRSVNRDWQFFLLRPLIRSYLTDGTLGIASPLANVWKTAAFMWPIASLAWLAALGSGGNRINAWWVGHFAAGILIYQLIGSRTDAVGFVISAIVVYHLLVRPIPLWRIAVVGPLATVYSYLISVWRALAGGTHINSIRAGLTEMANRLSFDSLLQFLSSTNLSDIRLFVLVANVYGRLLPWQYGTTLLRIGMQFVPRTLWPNKPLDLGLEIASLYAGPNPLAGTPPGFFPEMYLNFHIVGVLIGGFGLGAILAAMYRAWILERPTAARVVMYAILVPTILIVPSATFANAVMRAVIPIMTIVIAYRVVPLHAKRIQPLLASKVARQVTP